MWNVLEGALWEGLALIVDWLNFEGNSLGKELVREPGFQTQVGNLTDASVAGPCDSSVD